MTPPVPSSASSSSSSSSVSASAAATLRLEQMRAGVRAVPDDHAVHAALQELARADEELLARLPPSSFVARVFAEADRASSSSSSASSAAAALLPRPRPWGFRLATAAAPVLAAAGLVAVLERDPPSPGADVVVLKGDRPALLVYRLVDGEAVRVGDGDVFSSGDVVQLQTRAAGRRHGVVVSVDGRGHVTRHFPAAGADTALPPGTAALQTSFELDDAPGYERFVFVAADAALDVDGVERAVQQAWARGPRDARAPLALAGLAGRAEGTTDVVDVVDVVLTKR
jgi:hypothetical protein